MCGRCVVRRPGEGSNRDLTFQKRAAGLDNITVDGVLVYRVRKIIG
jgi:hypothetical protein